MNTNTYNGVLFATIRPWLTVGHQDYCGVIDANTLHVYRTDHPRQYCQTVLTHGSPEGIRDLGGDLLLNYIDGQAIPDDVLYSVSNWALRSRDSGRSLYLHCAVGQTRSPTLAILVLSVIERTHPVDSVGVIYKASWLQRGVPPNICVEPFKNICLFYERNFT